ncbi:MAG: hypothetical protein ACRDFY_04905, partial [Candidatus Limnocylindria bacterium]
MTANSRRPAFRLPWTDDGAIQPVEAAVPAPEPSEEAAAAPSDDAAPESEAAASGAESSGDAPPADEPVEDDDGSGSDEFLHNLVAAMRGVAEESRDANLAELRRTVDVRIEQLRASAAERVEELRRGSELDIAATGDWEKAEMDRVKAEAERRVAAQRAELERQLADHRAASDREIEATRRRLADYEVELTAFFTQLSEIRDPAAFVAAAKRMPRGPDLLPAPPAPSPAPATAPSAVTPAETGADVSMSELAAQRASLVPPPDAAVADSGEGDVPAEAEGEVAAAPPEVTNARLAERLAELDQRLSHKASNGESAEPVPAPSPATAPATATAPA